MLFLTEVVVLVGFVVLDEVVADFSVLEELAGVFVIVSVEAGAGEAGSVAGASWRVGVATGNKLAGSTGVLAAGAGWLVWLVSLGAGVAVSAATDAGVATHNNVIITPINTCSAAFPVRRIWVCSVRVTVSAIFPLFIPTPVKLPVD